LQNLLARWRGGELNAAQAVAALLRLLEDRP